MKKNILVLSMSDIHLGAPNTPAKHIIENIGRVLPDSSETGKIDFLFIVGDLFDRSLLLHDECVNDIKKWKYRLLRLCKKHDIAVRILEGTPSHDRRQSQMFETANVEAGFDVDLKYVSTLSIEYHERHDVHLLYVPDEWAHETDDVWQQVEQLLNQHQLEQVDFTLLHGAMDYQLPEFVSSPRHVTTRYLSITRRAVFVGHVHIASQREHLFAHGSFDRLSHGDEIEKGCWRVLFKTDGTYQATFVENVGAMRFDTYVLDGKSIEESFQYIERVKDLPTGSHVRIQAERGNTILSSVDTLRKQYPTIRWTVKQSNKSEKDVQTNLLVDLRYQDAPVQLTSLNLTEILLERIRSKQVEPDLLERLETKLREVL